MKKTLFLAMALMVIPAAHADFGYELGKVNGQTVGSNTLVGHVSLTPETLPQLSNAVLCVGTHNGDASMELTEGTTLTLPNALMIGGTGYGITDNVGGNGQVIVKQGATINVGSKTTSSGGHHVDVANSRQPISGELHVEGGTVNAAQFVVGAGKGTGLAVISDGGTVNLSNVGVAGEQLSLLVGYYNGYGDNGIGTLLLDHGTLNNTLSPNKSDLIGTMGKATVELKNNSSWDSVTFLYMGDIYQGEYDNGRVSAEAALSVSDDSSFRQYYLYADSGTTIRNAGHMELQTSSYLYNTKAENSGTLVLNGSEKAVDLWQTNLQNSGNIEAKAGAILAYDCELANTGSIDTVGMLLEGTVLENAGTIELNGGMMEAYEGATLDNTGTINGAVVLLGSGSTLRTGELIVSGCETPMNPEHVISMDYRTGLAEGTAVVLDADGDAPFTIGAHVSGGDTMQHLYSADFAAINEKVRNDLKLQMAVLDDKDLVAGWRDLADSDGVTVNIANIIGKNITANVTTDEASNEGSVTVALSGSNLVVRVGDNGSANPTEQDKDLSAEKVGTLGSYTADVAETTAGVRLHTEATDSSVTWEGHYMETVQGETAKVVDSTKVTVGSTEREGTLTVVSDSTLQNEGAVESDNVIVKGTLDNNGTISAATTVQDGATLKGSGTMGMTHLSAGSTFIVGNSPGSATFTGDLVIESGSSLKFSVAGLEHAADADHKGWESLTYSQIIVKGENAAVTLSESADIVIAFGGSELFSASALLHNEQVSAFSLTLISGGMEGAGINLDTLLDHTTFAITDEAAGMPSMSGGIIWQMNVTNAAYSIVGNNLVLKGDLHITRAPEPAGTTLSLLALAALCGRRKRR